MKKGVAIWVSVSLGVVAAFSGFHGLQLCISPAGHIAIESAAGGDCCPDESADHRAGGESLSASAEGCACCSCVDIPLSFDGMKDGQITKTRIASPMESSAVAEPVVVAAASAWGLCSRPPLSLFIEPIAVHLAQTVVLRT